jgi:hypothetical protein
MANFDDAAAENSKRTGLLSMACWFAGRWSEIVFDLEILDGGVLRDDCDQQLPKGRMLPIDHSKDCCLPAFS